MMTVDNFIQGIIELSLRYGTGDLNRDGFIIALALTFLCLAVLTIATLRRRREEPIQADRVPVLGRLEKFERSLNETRTEMMRATEKIGAEVSLLRQEVSQLKEHAGLGALPPEPRPEEQEVAELFPEAEISPHEVALSEKLKKTRTGILDRLRTVFSGRERLDEEAIEELRAQLIAADLGVATAEKVIESARADWQNERSVGMEQFEALLKGKLLEILSEGAPAEPIGPSRRPEGPLVVLVVGINGVGKTTTVAKLASQWKANGAGVLMVAADTFRAAAVDQLSEWGRRIDVPVVSGAENAKPSTVVFEAMERARGDSSCDVVIVDTAGRLHNKANLMQELEGIRNAISRHQPSSPDEVLLIVDGSTGQNAIQQAREFNEAVKLTGLVVTKLDGTPRGGVVVAIKAELGVPVRYIGVGETPADLRPFVPADFVEALFE